MLNLPVSEEEDEDQYHLDRVAAALLLLIALAVGFDLAFDRPTTLWSAHVALELLVVALCLALATVLWRRWRLTTAELGRTRRVLATSEAERDAWASAAGELMKGFREAVDQQFSRWQLTAAEREVALLILEGHGHRQIARQTGRSERTVRQHAVNIYDKSGLDGRSAFAGFFLHGLATGTSPVAGPDSRDS
jgi:DNA-binding CsgD family transcriptional regulator